VRNFVPIAEDCQEKKDRDLRNFLDKKKREEIYCAGNRIMIKRNHSFNIVCGCSSKKRVSLKEIFNLEMLNL